MDLLLLANHKENKFLLGNQLVEVGRGSFITSEMKLSERWGWSRTKVRSFLDVLERDNMLVKKSDTKKTTLTIVNYSDYQFKETIKEQQKNNEKTSKEQRQDTNNNENNENNDNNILFNYSERLKNVVSLLQNNIGVIPPILVEEVAEYSDRFELDMFEEAVKIACNKKVRTVYYVLGILRKWQDANITTIADLEALREEKKVDSKPISNKSIKKTTRFHNFEGRTDKYSADELEKVAERKRREFKERMKE